MITDSKKDKNAVQRLIIGLKTKWPLLMLLTIICLSFSQCANMQRPTGGPKDSIPPKLLNESPANLSRNFKEKEIVLTFDEYIKIANQQKEFTISPDANEQPLFKIRKKNLHITLPDSLEANTTYTINFGKGLVDYNEGNPLPNYTYVLATGDQLDSLTISGKVQNGYTKAFDYNLDKDVNVILIPTSRDSIFGKKKASYYTAVDSSGNFQFKNLREDTYRIYAIKEQNNDKIFNGQDEWIGFLQDSIVLTENLADVKLSYTKGRAAIFRNMEKKMDKDGSILLTFNRGIEDPSIRILDPADIDANKLVKFNVNNDTAKVYFEPKEIDSINFEVAEAGKVLDTIKFKKPRNLKVERTISPLYNFTNKVDRIKHIELTANYPLASVDKNKILVLEDSVSRRNFQLQQDSINKELYHIRYNWRPNKNYELVLQEGALIGPFDEVNKEQKAQFTFNETENYGDITLTFTGLDAGKQYIIELIDEKKEKVFDKRILPENHKLSYLKFEGGKYAIRVIEDSNKNGKWDVGDVYTRRQAEPIWYLERTFTIRANWEQNETIEVKFED